VEKAMNACVIDNVSVGKFMVHGCDCRECGQFVLTVPQKLDHVFVGKRMLETHLMVTSVLFCMPYSSAPAEVLKL
jgi:hypothetical protein